MHEYNLSYVIRWFKKYRKRTGNSYCIAIIDNDLFGEFPFHIKNRMITFRIAPERRKRGFRYYLSRL